MLETQKDAWEAKQMTIGESQQEVLRVIKSSPIGVTAQEVAEKLQWPINRISGRITELYQKGLIEHHGRKRKNPNSGKACHVWTATIKKT